MSKESRYEQLMRARFEKDEMSYAEENDLFFLLDAPAQYGNEEEMLEYIMNHEQASLAEIMEYFDSITPDGFPPNMTEEDLADVEDD